ncbi:MAG: SBBP repeat-containing protein [Bacteroidota bacterium]|nr:SBBP repeat-containing protein [Bacteroidota bacterium]
MKTLIRLCLVAQFCCMSYSLNLQAQVSQQWASYYNSPTNNDDNPVAMVADNAGNIYVTGVSRTITTAKDYTTVKYNSAGVQQWAARFNSAGAQDDEVKGIAVDASGNVFVTGSASIGVQITVKYNSAGVVQWTSVLGVPGGSPAVPGKRISPIALDPSGNIYVGGSRQFGSGQNSSYLLIKYNSSGDSLWTRTYKGTHFLAGLGSAIACIKVDGNSVYVTGKSFDQNPNLTASTFATTIKYDAAGVSQWIRKDTLTSGSDDVIGMEIDPSGNIIVTCNYGYDITTYKYNPAGTRLWKKTYTGISGDFYDTVTGLTLDQSGNIYLTGSSVRTTGNGGEDFLTVKYDPSGSLLWESFFNGTRNDGDYSKAIAVDGAGNVYITGIAYQTNFNFDFMTIKYDPAGVQKWKINYDGGFTNRRDEPIAIALDLTGNVIVTGISSRGVNTDDYATIKYSQSVGITQISSNVPDRFSLSQNYPNPFNPATVISYQLTVSNYTTLKVFDILGNEVTVLVNEKQNAGTYEVDFDGSNFPSGVYFYKLTTGNFSQTKKMNLIK